MIYKEEEGRGLILPNRVAEKIPGGNGKRLQEMRFAQNLTS